MRDPAGRVPGQRPFRRRSYRTIYIVAALLILAVLRVWRGEEELPVDGPRERPPATRSSDRNASDRAPSDAKSSHPTSSDALADGDYRVVRSVDGDTILIPPHRFVRLIGVNCPESVKPESPVEPYGPEASDFTREFVSGGTVRLTFDREREDRFGRTLAYVWVGDKLLNEELLKAGLARWERHFDYAGEMKDRFRNAQREAQKAHRGLWSQESQDRRKPAA